MAIVIDTDRPLRRPSELLELVMAVIAAGPADEGHWIEWKSSLDATTPGDAFAIARGILGFANREPATAHRFTGGLAYLVVGADSGGALGVDEVDPAKLEDALRPYLGTSGPVWGATYVKAEGATVLVITVEAPAYGDPIHTLRKTYQGDKGKGANEGTVFIRRQASTAPAGAADIEMLQARLLKGPTAHQTLDLDVDWVPEEFAITSLDLSDVALDEWIAARRLALISRPSPPVSEPLLGGLATGLRRDRRTDADFGTELEEHLSLCREKLVGWSVKEAVNRRINPVVLRVANPSSRNLSGVELILRIAAPARGYRDVDRPLRWEMPTAPRPLGWAEFTNPAFGFMAQPSTVALLQQSLSARSLLPLPSRVRIKNHKDPAVLSVVRIDVGDLRPDDAADTEPFLVVANAVPGATLEVHWRATSNKVDAIQEGTLALTVGAAVPPLALVPVTSAGDNPE